VTDRLFRAATALLERRVSRRSALVRMATAGSALVVAPIRYLTRPVAAAPLIACRNCGGGTRCCDGYTVFCCTLTGVNACPSYTYMGGWWKCTSYNGNGPCSGEGVRYYIDCNRLLDESCPGGCKCAFNKCSYRQTCCNVFRYGQCHTEVPRVTAIACRVIKCVNPCTLYSSCNCTYKQDNVTCSHEEDAICL
jgi:hypothetical protein